MVQVNQGTKKHTYLVSSYDNAVKRYGLRSLRECYVNPSLHKDFAFADCQEQEKFDNGRKGTITGYNCMAFTYAYLRVSRITGGY